MIMTPEIMQAMREAPSLTEVEAIAKAHAEKAGSPFPTVSETISAFANVLLQAGLSKEEVRLIARMAGMEVKDIMDQRGKETPTNG